MFDKTKKKKLKICEQATQQQRLRKQNNLFFISKGAINSPIKP